MPGAWVDIDLSTVVFHVNGANTYGQYTAGAITSLAFNGPRYYFPGLAFNDIDTYEVEFTVSDGFGVSSGLRRDTDSSDAAWLDGTDYFLGDGFDAGTVLTLTVGPGIEEWDDAVAVGADHVNFNSGSANHVTAIRYRNMTEIVVVPPPLNRAYGRSRSGRAVASWEPPVADVPGRSLLGLRHPLAQAVGPVTMVGPMPTFDYATNSGTMTRDRIVVNNKDVTFFRDVPTPLPDYQLVEPFLYGPGTLRFPQIAAAFEKPGSGALSWLRKYVPVKVQRVNLAGNVIATDYRGLVLGWEADGDDLVVQLGGKVTGLASMQSQQMPRFMKRADIGRLVFRAFESLRVPFSPRLGPVTGIEMGRFGGMKMLDYITAVLARGSTRTGKQYTVMPDSDGVFSMFRKDLTTVHATAYLDDARVRGSLRRDMTVEYTRVYGRGTTPGGKRVLNAIYPNLYESQNPPYPFDDEFATFGVGTTNEDTDTGDGISILLVSLQNAGALSREEVDTGLYDDDAEAAIKQIQKRALFPQTGEMNLATWQVLHNLNKTGTSTNWSKIMPMAADEATERWGRTADGSILEKNEVYDPSVPLIDADLDFGAGFTKSQMVEFAENHLEQAQTAHLVGTIAFGTGALVAGDHEWGDPITVLDDRDLLPGMNIKVVGGLCGDAGRVLHVSGKDVSGGLSTATVDSLGRDARSVWEIIRANREARKHPEGTWLQQNRATAEIKDILPEFDEVGGLMQPVEVEGETWKVFKVVLPGLGMVERFRIRTEDDEAAFVVAVFGLPIGPNKLNAACPNPLADKSGWSVESMRNQLDADHRLLYVAGEPEAPCGYFPGSAFDESPTITGRWEDDAGFAYRTGDNPFAYVAVFADRDTTFRGGEKGRIFWNQEVVGS